MTSLTLFWSILIASQTALAPAPAPAAKPLIKGEIGIQLYSLREAFKTDVPGTLAWIKSQGINEVETAGFYGLAPDAFRAELDKAGLKAVSMHVSYERLKNDIAGLAAEAKATGATYVGLAWYPHDSKEFTMADAEKAASDFNEFGKALKDNGLMFFYHNHGYEFQPWSEGGTLFDYLVTHTDPELVFLEMDVQWVVFPGQDPTGLLKKYPKRFRLMHMKDLKKGVVGNLTGGGGPDLNVAMGDGQTDWPSVFKAARKTGIEHFLLEDESSLVKQQVPMSIKYLRGE